MEWRELPRNVLLVTAQARHVFQAVIPSHFFSTLGILPFWPHRAVVLQQLLGLELRAGPWPVKFLRLFL